MRVTVRIGGVKFVLDLASLAFHCAGVSSSEWVQTDNGNELCLVLSYLLSSFSSLTIWQFVSHVRLQDSKVYHKLEQLAATVEKRVEGAAAVRRASAAGRGTPGTVSAAPTAAKPTAKEDDAEAEDDDRGGVNNNDSQPPAVASQ